MQFRIAMVQLILFGSTVWAGAEALEARQSPARAFAKDVGCDLSTCPDFTTQGVGLYEFFDANLPEAYDFTADDTDGTGIPDRFELALFERLVCNNNDSLGGELTCIFEDNRSKLSLEAAHLLFRDYEDALAGLFCISSELQIALGADALQRQYQVFTGSAKAAGEPLAPQGDPDSDGLSNLQEYQNNLANGGGIDEYVEAALNPLLDGSNAQGLPVAGLAGGGGLLLVLSGLGVLQVRKRK